jgi:hypothetical protein
MAPNWTKENQIGKGYQYGTINVEIGFLDLPV